MTFLSDLLLACTPKIACGVAGIVAALFIVAKLSESSKLDGIPTVGSSGWLGSWWAALRYLTDAPRILQQGYDKYESAPFKIAELRRWTVILSNREHVEELRSAPDDIISFEAAKFDVLQIEYTMGPPMKENPYHIPILRSQLTRSIGGLYPEIRDEIITSFEDVLDLRGNEWKSVLALNSMQQILCRTSNRVFVGLPLCRDPDWIDLTTKYALEIVKGARIIGLFPELLKPVAARFLTNIDQSKRRGTELLGPMIKERQRHLNDCGKEWVEKPIDLLSWLMEAAESSSSTVEELTARMLAVNFAVMTTANSFTHALLYLAANPQYITPLREEVEAVVHKKGWSKAALGKMWKVDGFLRECQRLEGISIVSLRRKALKDFTFSDGTFIPKGTTLVVAARCIHHDEAWYDNAHTFDPLRFAPGDCKEAKYRFASTTGEYLPFGHGRYACPGRFFAAAEMKTMLAHLVVTYDVKLEDQGTRPPSLHFETVVVPDPRARVMFRRRTE